MVLFTRIKEHSNTFKKYYSENERVMMLGAFFLGFVWDSLTLTRIDLTYDTMVLFTYILLAGSSIVILNLHDAKYLNSRFISRNIHWVTLVMQFGFGGLFSGYIVFYSRSATLITSWPFLLFLILLIVGNELYKQHYSRLTFQMSIFFISVYSFFIFYIPIVVHRLGPWIFLTSGIISILVIIALVRGMHSLIPEHINASRRYIVMSTTSIFLLFNFFYFTNILPPLPLSIKDIGIYHLVERTSNGGFAVTFEEGKWYQPFKDSDNTFHRSNGEPVYAYASVFAPTDLRTKILHRWSYFDESTNRWVISSEVPYEITGGADGGSRGFTYKEHVFDGTWRVDVITERGQVLGRDIFKIDSFGEPRPLVTEMR
ncbi:hypothetical protein COB55_00750 [Candidatus Wolfebacteria bacterium]|nr:MAG: hypothetical protein COB55_00750 [Candidatus Wolfebacteria bacterium]